MKVKLLIILVLLLNNAHSQDFYSNNVKLNAQQQILKYTDSDTIVHTIPTPHGMANGITFYGNSLWVASTNYAVYKISPTDGAIQKTLDVEIGYATGITFVKPNLYVVDRVEKRICKMDTASGNIIDFFNTPEQNPNGFPGGLTWDGSNLWYNCAIVDSTYELNISGEVLSKYKAFGEVPTGLAFDGSSIWSINSESDVIYQISLPDFVLIDSIYAPGPVSNGLAFDGEYLWVSENSKGLIFQIDIGGTSNISFNEAIHNMLNVWPNPSSGHLTVELPANNKAVNFKIYNMGGQLIKSIQVNEKKQSGRYHFDLSDIKSGVYFLTTKFHDELFSKKILIK
ncbi:MAG: T9SS type A sorting domain-containing protein [Bacteroidales bacterium]|nr:T9SS type A sorting domain-containing protein [Bacteroidales bacterium]